MGDLEQQLLNTNIVLMAAGAWFVLWVVRKIWKGMDNIKWVRNLKPLYPAILCQGLVWIPGAMPGITAETGVYETIAPRILTGLWCGFLASIGYQLLRRLLGRQGVDLPEDPSKLMPSVPPASKPVGTGDGDTAGVAAGVALGVAVASDSDSDSEEDSD